MPIADDNNIFGRIVTRRDIQLALVCLLQKWVPTYVGQLEKQAQLPTGSVPMPPDSIKCYRGGLDFETWEPSWSPAYTVVVQAIGRPELTSGGGSYIQLFDAQVGCTYQYDGRPPSLGPYEEDNAIQYVDILGMAACAAILQHGSLGMWPDGSSVATRTKLNQFPVTSFPLSLNESTRRVCRSTFSINVLVSNILTESWGPTEPLANPYTDVGDWPLVINTDVNVEAVPVDEAVPPPASDNPGNPQ